MHASTWANRPGQSELQQQLGHRVRRILKHHPRQKAMIVGCYFCGSSLPALAGLLDISIRSAQTLKITALSRLRKNNSLIQYLLGDWAGGEKGEIATGCGDKPTAQLQMWMKSWEQQPDVTPAVVDFAYALFQIDDPSLDCDTCQTRLPEYIAAELNYHLGVDDHSMRRHLDVCQLCGAMYLDLLEMALLSEQGPWPVPNIPLDFSFLDSPPDGSS